jgi:hypothetical protein
MTTRTALNISALALVCWLASAPAYSAVAELAPDTLSYQGRLTQSGTAVSGAVSLTFRLYLAGTGGSALWTETQSITTVGGLYSAILGKTTAFPAGLFNQALWLSVQVGAEAEMTPRQELTSTAYSQLAKVATSLDTGFTNGLVVKVNGSPVLQVDNQYASPNIIGGYSGNGTLPGAVGATVAGGGRAVATCYDPVAGTDSKSCANVAGYFSTVSGGEGNTAYWYSSVSGGTGNNASGTYSTVSGGTKNNASGTYSTVSGGTKNNASEYFGSVSGGISNTASALASTVSGGQDNTASGETSTVAGGFLNTASGSGAYAAGGGANATHASSFVWNGFTDNSTGAIPKASLDSGRVHFYSPNGFTVFTTNPGVPNDCNKASPGTDCWVHINHDSQQISTSSGGYLTAAGEWKNGSDRNSKTDFQTIDSQDVLARVVAMPVTQWRYKSEGAGVTHIGPMAQDFFAAFKLGSDDKAIGTVDESGVALAAIQGLNQKLEMQLGEKNAQMANQAEQLAVQSAKITFQSEKLANQTEQLTSQSQRIQELESRVANTETLQAEVTALRSSLDDLTLLKATVSHLLRERSVQALTRLRVSD